MMKTEHTKIEFGFGVQLTKHHTQIPTDVVSAGLANIRNKAIEYFDGVTFTATEGAWRNSAGSLYVERGVTLSILTEMPNTTARTLAIICIAEEIKRQFDQEAVAVTLTPVNFSIL